MLRRVIAASVLLASGVLSACSSGPSNVAEPQAEVSHIEWTQCGESQCGSVTVPVNHGIVDGPTLRLQVYKRDAVVGDAPRTLFLIPDRKYGMNARELVEDAPLIFGSAVRSFNLVGISTRGTSESPIPTPNEHVVSTHDTANDIDVVRRSLSIKKVSLLGWGSGATAGAEYVLVHPKSVRSAVLDAPFNPLQSMVNQAITAIDNSRLAVNTAMKWCASHLSCSMNLNVADVVSEFKSHLRKGRLPNGIDYATLARAAETALADGKPQQFFEALTSVNEGNGVLMLSLAGESITPAESFAKCADVNYAQAAKIASEYAKWARKKTRQFYIGNNDIVYGLCSSFPESAHPLGKLVAAEKSKEARVLVVTARGDMVVPPKVSAALAKTMEWSYTTVYGNRHLVVGIDRAITAEAVTFLLGK